MAKILNQMDLILLLNYLYWVLMKALIEKFIYFHLNFCFYFKKRNESLFILNFLILVLLIIQNLNLISQFFLILF